MWKHLRKKMLWGQIVLDIFAYCNKIILKNYITTYNILYY